LFGPSACERRVVKQQPSIKAFVRALLLAAPRHFFTTVRKA
jgi:hypothetical protein